MTETKIFKISGMHCVACAMNIDGELEDSKGIEEATTNYAKQETQVKFNSNEINTEKIISIIEKVGYKVSI